jgi:hypothetical protein
MFTTSFLRSVCRSFNGTSKRVEMALSSHTKLRQLRRRRRTNTMLIIVSVVFFLSWAPLNCFNLVMTFSPWLFKVSQSFAYFSSLLASFWLSYLTTTPTMHDAVQKRANFGEDEMCFFGKTLCVNHILCNFWLERVQYLGAVFRIHDILVRIRIRGSMPLTNESGS